MANNITWKLTARIGGEPDVSVTGLHPTDAVERTRLVLAAGETDLAVTLAPQATLLVASASSYGTGDTEKITVKVNSAGDALDLDAPLVLIGRQLLARFAGADLTSLSFTSTLAKDATLEILTARDATPEP